MTTKKYVSFQLPLRFCLSLRILVQGTTTTLCVRRAVYVDPATGKEDPSKKGICSNFLCDAKPGESYGSSCSLSVFVHQLWCDLALQVMKCC